MSTAFMQLVAREVQAGGMDKALLDASFPCGPSTFGARRGGRWEDRVDRDRNARVLREFD
jgi:hypothetical protein